MLDGTFIRQESRRRAGPLSVFVWASLQLGFPAEGGANFDRFLFGGRFGSPTKIDYRKKRRVALFQPLKSGGARQRPVATSGVPLVSERTGLQV